MRSRIRTLAGMTLVCMALTGCLVSVATIVIDAERERLADLDRFRMDVAAEDCSGLSESYEDLVADREHMNDFDQRSDILLDAMRLDGC